MQTTPIIVIPMLIALILWGLLNVPVTLDTQETEPHALVNKIFCPDNGLKNFLLKKIL